MRRPMAVLTRDAILREMELGRLRVEPFSPDQLGPASIDLTLGDEIRVIEPAGPPIVISEDAALLSGLELARFERRQIAIRGSARPLDVRIVPQGVLPLPSREATAAA